MKKTVTIIISLLISTSLFSKDYKKTEDIINSILNEKSEKSIKKVELNRSDGSKKNVTPINNTEDQTLLKTGIELYNSGLFSHALKQLRELNSKYPQSQYIDISKIWIGKTLIRQYKYTDAIKTFETIKNDSGEYPTSLYNIALSYELMGNIIKSISYYKRVSSQFPGREMADNALLKSGKLHLKQGKGMQALKETIKLIQYYKDRETIDDAYYMLGTIFEKDPDLKDIERARKIYKLFLKKTNPSSGEEHFINSPLKKRVKQNLKYIEKTYFRLED